MALLDRFRRVTTHRDDAALPHELAFIEAAGAAQQGEDDGQDGNSTPNGGR